MSRIPLIKQLFASRKKIPQFIVVFDISSLSLYNNLLLFFEEKPKCLYTSITRRHTPPKKK